MNTILLVIKDAMWVGVYKKELDENKFRVIAKDSIYLARQALQQLDKVDVIVVDEKIVDDINVLMHFISQCLETGLPVVALSPLEKHRDLFKSKGCHMAGERFTMPKMVKNFFSKEED